MAVTAECPICGHKGNVPDQFKGKKVKCRECSNMFTVGGPAPAAVGKQKSNPDLNGSSFDFGGDAGGGGNPFDFDAPEAPPPPKPTRKSEPGIQKANKSDPGSRRPAPSKSAPGNQPSPMAKRPLKRKNSGDGLPIGAISLGVIGLILGGAGMAVASQGMIGLASVPVAGFGLLLAIGGLVMALGRSALGLVAPVLALLVCLGGIGVGGYHTYNLIASGALDVPDDKGASAQTTQPGGGPSTETTLTPVAIPTKPSEPPPPPPPPPDQWVDARQGYRMGKAVVKVTGLEADVLRGKDGKEVSKDKHLLIRLEIKNVSGSDLDYYSWATSAPQGGDPLPQLTDDKNAEVKWAQPDGVFLVNQVAKGTQVPAGQTVVDVLPFQLPPDTITGLKLELTGSNLGESGRLKLQLPTAMLAAFVKGGAKDPDPGGGPPKVGDPRMAKFVQEQVALLAKAKTPVEKTNAISFIAGCGKDAAPAAPDLAKYLKGQPDVVRAAAADALGKIGPPAKQFIPELRAALKDEFFKVKANAARALGNMGPDAKVAVDDLLPLLKSKDEEVPNNAKEAIRKLDPAKLPK